MLIDWFTIIAQLINFLVLVWLLKRFLYKPILQAIDERETQISKKILNAEKVQLDAEKVRSTLENKISKLDDERDDFLKTAKSEADLEYKRLIKKAKESIDESSKQRIENLKTEEEEMEQLIIKNIQLEVFAITRKVLKELTGIKLESQMVDVFIERMNDLDEEGSQIMNSAESSSQAIVRSIVELTEKQQSSVKKIIFNKMKKNIKLKFEITKDSMSGIEFILNGQKLVWSIDDYLKSLEDKVHHIMNTEKYS